MPEFSTHPLSTKGRTMPIEASTSAGPSRHGPCGGINGHNCLQYVDQMWEKAYKLHSQEMDDLLGRLENDIRAQSPSCSLLSEIGSSEYKGIFKKLKADTMANYTPKCNSVFLQFFDRKHRQTQAQYAEYVTKFMRLGTIDNENKEDGYDAEKHDVKLFFKCKKALQVILLFNKLTPGLEITDEDVRLQLTSARVTINNATNERSSMGRIFDGPKSCLQDLFAFTKESGLRVQIGELYLKSAGNPDFAVNVIVDKRGKTKQFENCVAICEFKRPNAGFWVPWTLLTGKTWTDDEKDAFFKLKEVHSDCTIVRAKSYEFEKYDPAIWDYATRAIDQVGSKRVDVRYYPILESIQEKQRSSKRRKLDMTEEQMGSSGSGGSNKDTAGENLPSSYFISGNDELSAEEFTKLLDDAGFLTSFDSLHKALTKATYCAVLASCSNVLIVDGMTIIAGSLREVERSKGDSNPTESEDVLDLHFYKTHMMQTHDQNSTLDFMNYVCNRAFSDHNFQKVGYQLLTYAEQFQGQIDEDNTKELNRLMKQHEFTFDY